MNDEDARNYLWGLAILGVLLFGLSMCGTWAEAHCPADCGCPCSSATPVPSATPKPSATPIPTAPASCKVVLAKGSPFKFTLPDGDIHTKTLCFTVNEPTPPSKIRVQWYDESDQQCGKLSVSVQQMAGARIFKSTQEPMSDGSLTFAKRVGRLEDPARVANGLYIVTVTGHPAVCIRYHIGWDLPS